MIKKLNLYITKKYLKNFLLVLLIFSAVVFLIEIVEHTRKFKGRSSFADLALISFYFLPKALNMIYPLIIGIASIITFSQLSYHRELIVMRSHGLSIWKILTPICIITILIGIFKIAILSPIESNLQDRYTKLKFKNTHNKSTFYMENGQTWFVQKEENSYYLINIKKLNIQSKQLHNVYITEIDIKNGFKQKIIAQTGKFHDRHWLLENVTILKANGEQKFLNLFSFKTPYSILKIEKSINKADTVSFWKLPKTIKFLKESGFHSIDYEIQYYKLLLQPFSFLAIAMFACFFGLNPPRAKQSFKPALYYGGSILAYFFMVQFFETQAKSSFISAQIALSIPILILLLCSISLLIHKEDG